MWKFPYKMKGETNKDLSGLCLIGEDKQIHLKKKKNSKSKTRNKSSQPTSCCCQQLPHTF